MKRVLAVALASAVAVSCSRTTPNASAFQITSREQLVGGRRALGEVGDFKISNGIVHAIVQDVGTSRGFGAFFQQWDVMLTPITALPTPRIGTTEYLTLSDNPSVLDWFGNLWRFFAYTPLSNLCGVPAVSIPMGRQDHGLPFGLQLQAAQGQDGLLLQLAAQAERALGGRWNDGRRPGVHVTA